MSKRNTHAAAVARLARRLWTTMTDPTHLDAIQRAPACELSARAGRLSFASVGVVLHQNTKLAATCMPTLSLDVSHGRQRFKRLAFTRSRRVSRISFDCRLCQSLDELWSTVSSTTHRFALVLQNDHGTGDAVRANALSTVVPSAIPRRRSATSANQPRVISFDRPARPRLSTATPRFRFTSWRRKAVGVGPNRVPSPCS